MPPYSADQSSVPQAMSTDAVLFFGSKIKVDNNGFITRSEDFENVTAGEKSRVIALAPVVETHGVRGFVVTVIWPSGATTGAVEIQGADLDQEEAFASLGTITYPAKQYASPAGQVINFMRVEVKTLPTSARLIARLMIR